MPMTGAVSDMLHAKKGPYESNAVWLRSWSDAFGSPCSLHAAAAVLAGKLHAVPLTLVSHTCLRSVCAGRHLVPGGLAQGTMMTCQHAALPLLVAQLHWQQRLHSSLRMHLCCFKWYCL